MAVKYSCDKCGAEMAGDGKVTGHFTVNPPHNPAGLQKFDADICPKCFEQVKHGINAALRGASKNG